MRSLRSRTVQDSRTATVLQPTQPGRTVTRSHLCERQKDPQRGPRGDPRPPCRPGSRSQGPSRPSAPRGGVTCPPSPASSPRARVRPSTRVPGHGQPRCTARPGAGLEGGLLMAQAGAAPAGLSRSPQSSCRSRGGNARGSRGRAGGARRRRWRRAPGHQGPRRRPRARARPQGPLAEAPPLPSRPRPAPGPAPLCHAPATQATPCHACMLAELYSLFLCSLVTGPKVSDLTGHT